jgi:hypothetical protein
VRLARRLFPVTTRFHGEHFVVRAGSAESHESAVPGAPVEDDETVERARPGALMLTPLALALVMVETADLVFAVDSIPAIFAITADPFLVFTSNVFAILGLRSLYFALAGLIDSFAYLKTALAVVLVMVGGKMLAVDWLKATLGASFNFWVLGAVILVLAAGVAASLLVGRRGTGRGGRDEPFDLEAELIETVAALRGAGFADEADRIAEAMSLPTTSSSELLGEIGVAIRSVQRHAGRNLPPEVRRRLARCLRGARSAWRGFVPPAGRQ